MKDPISSPYLWGWRLTRIERILERDRLELTDDGVFRCRHCHTVSPNEDQKCDLCGLTIEARERKLLWQQDEQERSTKRTWWRRWWAGTGG